jgi:ribosomal protein L29
MSHLKARDIDNLSDEARSAHLLELREELLQLRAQQALGGSASNFGDYKATRRSIARLLTKMNEKKE